MHRHEMETKEDALRHISKATKALSCPYANWSCRSHWPTCL